MSTKLKLIMFLWHISASQNHIILIKSKYLSNMAFYSDFKVSLVPMNRYIACWQSQWNLRCNIHEEVSCGLPIVQVFHLYQKVRISVKIDVADSRNQIPKAKQITKFSLVGLIGFE